MSLPAGAMAAALRFSSSDDVSDMKRKFLDASVADGRGGEHATGVRAWVVYSVWGRGLSPLPDAQRMRADFSYAAAIEDRLEDFAIWYATYEPFGNRVSHTSVGKYVSQVRAWYHRITRVVLGLGAEGSRTLPTCSKGTRDWWTSRRPSSARVVCRMICVQGSTRCTQRGRRRHRRPCALRSHTASPRSRGAVSLLWTPLGGRRSTPPSISPQLT